MQGRCHSRSFWRLPNTPVWHSRKEGSALWILEALLAAGYRPTVWRNVAPPPFLRCSSRVLEVFDPFDFHPPTLSPRQGVPHTVCSMALLAGCRSNISSHTCTVLSSGCCRVLFVARGGTSSSSSQRLWPNAFKAATRTLLLAGCPSGMNSSSLATLPAPLLLHILQLAAAPMSAARCRLARSRWRLGEYCGLTYAWHEAYLFVVLSRQQQ